MGVNKFSDCVEKKVLVRRKWGFENSKLPELNPPIEYKILEMSPTTTFVKMKRAIDGGIGWHDTNHLFIAEDLEQGIRG